MRKDNEIGRVFTWIACVVISMAIIYALLISSFELVAYGDMNYYQSEYEKYEVADDLDMEMEDIMYVTEEMMSYLRGERATLIVETVVDGEVREFFNADEISHMEDVRELFIAGIYGRSICVIVALTLVSILLLMMMDWKLILPRAFRYTTLGMGVLAAVIGGLFATDFYKYFEIFHKIFFEGDTWIFDPNTSLMINMLPEGFFYDMALKIVLTFIFFLGTTFIVACVCSFRNKRKKCL